MISRLSILILPLFLLLSGVVLAQEGKPEEEHTPKEIFLKQMANLSADGGVWETENPGFKEDEEYSAKTYRYEVKQGVHAEQFRITISSDINGVGWWTSWDSYFLWHPVKRQGVYHGVGGDGSTSDGRLYAANEDGFANVFEVFTYEGARSVHKDVFTWVGENEITSRAYELKGPGDWEFYEELNWKRVKDS